MTTNLATLGVEVQTKGAAQAAQQLGQFSSAAKGAAGAADTLENQLNATSAAQSKVAATARPLPGAMDRIGAAFNNNSSRIQNTSFQLSDLIVQMEMGVPASRALGQQLPQMLGGFGPLGAVIGVAVGALLTFAPSVLGAADGAEALTKAMNDLTDAVDAYASASAAAASPTDKLIEQYGAASGKARELLQINQELAKLNALDALAASSEALVGAFGDFEGQTGEQLIATGEKVEVLRAQMADLQKQAETASGEQAGMISNSIGSLQVQIDQLAGYRKGIESVKEALGATQEEAITFSAALADLQTALTVDEQVVALAEVKRLMLEITGGTENMTKVQRELTAQMIAGALASLDLSDGTAAAANNISAATSNATALANEMGRAAVNAISMATNATQARREAEIRLQFQGDPGGQAGAMFDLQSGIMQGSQDMGVRMQAATLRAQTVAEAERLAEVTAQLDAQTAQLTQTMSGAGSAAAKVDQEVAKLTETFDPFQKVVEGVAGTIESELNSAFASVLDGTKTLGEALLDFASNVLAQVAQDLFAQQFSKPIAAGIAEIFSAKGNVFNSAGVTPFANGGVVSGPTIFPFANGIGLMGEAGPEAIMPLARGADGKLGVTAANGNSAPNVIINNYSGQEATASSDSAGNLVVEIGRAIAQDITSGGPSYRAIRTTFGLGNRLQQRG
jgi:lambda family phage tail tape measure protein